MAIPEMTDDLNIISDLSNRPNQDNALTSSELKSRFDKGPNLIKTFLNTVVIPALNKLEGAVGFKGGHGELNGREDADQHPMSAITGLVKALAEKAGSSHNHNANEVNEGVLSTDRIPVVPVRKGGTGGATRNDGFTNLAFLGTNPVTVDTDTPDSWIALGNGFAGITAVCTNAQTDAYGTIINMIVNNFNVHQIFIGADADLSFRCGSKNQGWIFNWRSVLTKAGGVMTGALTMEGPLVLTKDKNYFKSIDDVPEDLPVGTLFYVEVVMNDG